MRGNWQDFNWHDASRGPSAVAELLVFILHCRYVTEHSLGQFVTQSNRHAAKFNSKGGSRNLLRGGASRLLSLPLPLPLRSRVPLNQLRGFGERRKLPRWGPGRSPGRKRIQCTLKLRESHRWQSFRVFRRAFFTVDRSAHRPKGTGSGSAPSKSANELVTVWRFNSVTNCLIALHFCLLYLRNGITHGLSQFLIQRGIAQRCAFWEWRWHCSTFSGFELKTNLGVWPSGWAFLSQTDEKLEILIYRQNMWDVFK